VTGDRSYGGDRRLRVWLEQQEQPFVLAVTSAEPLFALRAGHCGPPRADRIAAHLAAHLPADEWQRLSAGAGAKGPRWYDWARVRLARLQLSAEERRWEHWVLVRRSRHDPTELAYYVVFAPAGTSLRTLARVAGQRWRIEQSFERAKGEVGLDHYDVRRWDGWYRHMTLAMFALAYLAVLRARLQAQPVQSEPPSQSHPVRPRPKSQKGAIPAANRLERRPVTLDCARDSACTLGGRSGSLCGGDQLCLRLVAMATTPPGAGQALSLPASPGSPMT